jgi:hypothetical protein
LLRLPGAGGVDFVLQQAEALGAPMAAVQRAIQISHQSVFDKKDVLAVFDISQPLSKKDSTFLDFKSGRITAHDAAHGRHNGYAKVTKFKGFQTDLDMVPLGPLKTAHSAAPGWSPGLCNGWRRPDREILVNRAIRPLILAEVPTLAARA